MKYSKLPCLFLLPAVWLAPLLLNENKLQAQQKIVKRSSPIGVFDSGTGGLTVLEALLTIDEFNNITGEPGKDGKPDFDVQSILSTYSNTENHPKVVVPASRTNVVRNASSARGSLPSAFAAAGVGNASLMKA